MIKIIDKINNTTKKVKNLEIVIHPITHQIYFLEDYQIPGTKLNAIIFDNLGVLFTYSNLKKNVKKKAKKASF